MKLVLKIKRKLFFFEDFDSFQGAEMQPFVAVPHEEETGSEVERTAENARERKEDIAPPGWKRVWSRLRFYLRYKPAKPGSAE